MWSTPKRKQEGRKKREGRRERGKMKGGRREGVDRSKQNHETSRGEERKQIKDSIKRERKRKKMRNQEMRREKGRFHSSRIKELIIATGKKKRKTRGRKDEKRECMIAFSSTSFIPIASEMRAEDEERRKKERQGKRESIEFLLYQSSLCYIISSHLRHQLKKGEFQ